MQNIIGFGLYDFLASVLLDFVWSIIYYSYSTARDIGVRAYSALLPDEFRKEVFYGTTYYG